MLVVHWAGHRFRGPTRLLRLHPLSLQRVGPVIWEKSFDSFCWSSWLCPFGTRVWRNHRWPDRSMCWGCRRRRERDGCILASPAEYEAETSTRCQAGSTVSSTPQMTPQWWWSSSGSSCVLLGLCRLHYVSDKVPHLQNPMQIRSLENGFVWPALSFWSRNQSMKKENLGFLVI